MLLVLLVVQNKKDVLPKPIAISVKDSGNLAVKPAKCHIFKIN